MKTNEIKAEDILKDHEEERKMRFINPDTLQSDHGFHNKILTASNSMSLLPPKVLWKKY